MESAGKHLKFKVFVRLRPAPADSGGGHGADGVCKTEHRIITLHDPSKEHSSEFVFDRVFSADSPQEVVFNEVGKPLVEHAMQGYNACCFAYGQTSSGKTYTMFGKETGEPELRGMIPRAIEELFRVAAEVQAGTPTRYAFFVSYLEIYLEQVRDLGKAALMSKESGGRVGRKEMDEWARSNLDVMEDASGQTSVKDLQYIEVASADEALSILRDGVSLRATASTALNDVSSRSHTVFTISIVQYRDGNKPVTGRLHLVDLAGSERQSRTNSEGQRLTEAKSINKSLTALGKVVMALSQEGEKGHVPFRDSKLTRILKDSLQGNSLTSMMAALNPLPDNAEECFNTLQFAVRCQNIDLTPHINVVAAPGAGAGGGGAGGLGGAASGDVDSLISQIAALQEELDFTHAHYQKIIESVAGPGWTANMGPLERGGSGADLGGGSAGADGGASSAALAELRRGSMRLGSAGAGGPDGKNLSNSPSAVGGDAGRMRRLEMQLEGARTAQRDAEDALARRRLDYDALRDRSMAKERTQFIEIRKLRQQVSDLQSKLADQQSDTQHKLDDSHRRQEQEVARLHKDNDLLRAQLAQLSGSIAAIMDTRSAKAVAESKAREHIKQEAERHAAEKVAAVAQEKDNQVEALRQKGEYLLRAKSDEAHKLQQELLELQRRSAADAAALQQELDYLAGYAERVTGILRHMEAGTYGVVERGGLRAFRLPARDRPPALDGGRLAYLKQANGAAERLLEAAAAAAAGPPPSALSLAGSSALSPSRTEGGTGLTAASHSLRRSQETSPQHAQQQGTPRSGEAAAVGGELSAGGESAAGSLQLGPELEALKAKWEAEMKGSITNQVMSELRSERTAEYIRSLEAAVAQARQELQRERRRQNEATVALRSAQRVAARTDSPLNAVMQGGTLALPQKWGHGHTAAPYHHQQDASGGVPAARPMTAAARLTGSSGGRGGSAMASRQSFFFAQPAQAWQRPSTATAMQMLTTGFRDSGLTC